MPPPLCVISLHSILRSLSFHVQSQSSQFIFSLHFPDIANISKTSPIIVSSIFEQKLFVCDLEDRSSFIVSGFFLIGSKIIGGNGSTCWSGWSLNDRNRGSHDTEPWRKSLEIEQVHLVVELVHRDRSIHILSACQLHGTKMTHPGLLPKGLTSAD